MECYFSGRLVMGQRGRDFAGVVKVLNKLTLNLPKVKLP